MLKIVSPTGCVHAVDDTAAHHHHTEFYSTVCSHAGWRSEYWHKWKKTVKDVTCKRCLKVLNRKLKHKETGWTKSKRDCRHRYPHLRYGIICVHKCSGGLPDRPRLCEFLYCPIPHAPTSAEMIEVLVCKTITSIGKELILADRSFKLRFDVMAVHCGWRKPGTPKWQEVTLFRCTHKNLEDPNFGWACSMNSCPHMGNAMNWRASNDM